MSIKSKKICLSVLLLSVLLWVGGTTQEAYADWDDILDSIGVASEDASRWDLESDEPLDQAAAVAVNVFLGVAASIAFIGIIYSGIKFIISRGDPKAVMTAKQAVTYSVLALLLVASAFAIGDFILNSFEGRSAGSSAESRPSWLPDPEGPSWGDPSPEEPSRSGPPRGH